MVSEIERLFPRLQSSEYRVTSPEDAGYNCIAWAAEDNGRRWWPGGASGEYWPDGAPCSETLSAFVRAFETLGYVSCLGHDMEAGFQKIAIFVDATDEPTHAARQLPDGRWTSKLGRLEDVEHHLREPRRLLCQVLHHLHQLR